MISRTLLQILFILITLIMEFSTIHPFLNKPASKIYHYLIQMNVFQFPYYFSFQGLPIVDNFTATLLKIVILHKYAILMASHHNILFTK